MPGSGTTSLVEGWRAELLRGLECLRGGDHERAQTHFERAHRWAPEEPEVLYALGRERLRQGLKDDAARLLRGAWERDPTLAAAAAALARSLLPDRPAEAHAVLDQALARHGDEPGLYVVRGEVFLEEERGDEARAAFEEAARRLEAEGRDAPATRAAIAAGLARVHNLAGVALGRQGRTEEALFAFKRASDLDPEWSGPLVNMGVAFARLGRAARARSCYERALARDPDNAVARFNLAHLYRDGGDLARAEQAYRRVLAIEPEYPDAAVSLAEVLLERGAAKEALALLEAEVERSPDDAQIRFHLGVALERLGDLARAERELSKALALDEDHVGALCMLASVLARGGRYLQAASLVKRAREIDPERAAAFWGTRDTE